MPALVAIVGAGVVGTVVALSVASRAPEGAAAPNRTIPLPASSAGQRVVQADGRVDTPAPAASQPALALKSRAAAVGASAALFSVPPPPPKVQARAMPAQVLVPVPPLLPFKYLGQMDEGGRAALFVGIGDRSLSLRVGDVVDGRYRLEAVKPGAAEFTFLPMAAKQTLTFGTGP